MTDLLAGWILEINNIPLCEDQASVQAGAGLGPMGVTSPRLR